MDEVKMTIEEATPEKPTVSPTVELGVSGLEQYGGTIDEEKLPQLRGSKAMKMYRQMMDNDATVGAIVFALEMLLRKAPVSVESASDSPDDIENKEFVEQCLGDMSHTWEDAISEIVTMCGFGWSAVELCYKRRLGPEQTDPTLRSNYDDGKIGWRKFAARSQESLDRWEFDEDGGVKGHWQIPPNCGKITFLPIEKMLYFRTTSRKGNPEGKSLLRTSFVAWFRKKEIERIESIGIERDLAGLPMLYLPEEVMASKDPQVIALRDAYKKILRNIRNDDQACLMLPSMFDEKGNRTLEFTLLGTGSTRLIDTGGVIQRYKQDIATTILADVILLGHEKVGSFALADSKTHLFAVALGAYMDSIAAVFNRFAIPRLFRVNGERLEQYPKIKFGDLEEVDLLNFFQALNTAVSAGAVTMGNEEDEKKFRKMLNMSDKVPSVPLPSVPLTPQMGPDGKPLPKPEIPVAPGDEAPEPPVEA
jgi:hypothetical protein